MKSRKRANHTPYELRQIQVINDLQAHLLFKDCERLKKHDIIFYHFTDNKYYTFNTSRVASCKAYLIYIKDYIAVVSYHTVIGLYNVKAQTYFSTGAYSNTTYQHERKALEALTNKGYHINKVNKLWTVDNFAS